MIYLLLPPLVGCGGTTPPEYHPIFTLQMPEVADAHENFQSLVDVYFKSKEQYQKETINCSNCQSNVTITKKGKIEIKRNRQTNKKHDTFSIAVELIDEKSAIVFSINRQLMNPIWSTPGFNTWPKEEQDKHQGIKLDRPVELSNIIRLPVSNSASGSELYSLVATIEHRTNDKSISAGHYIAYLRYKDEWYIANDRQPLMPMSESEYHDVRQSYIFLYKKNTPEDNGTGWS